MNKKLAALILLTLMFSPSTAVIDGWEVYTPFRLCGAKLLRHIMDEDLCNPNKCKGKKPTFPRFRRAADTDVISKACCEQMCTPYRVAEICCSRN